LQQVLRLELAARPAISFFELNPQLIVQPVHFAILDAGFAVIAGELEVYNGVGRYGFVDSQASSGGRYVIEYGPLAVNRA